MTSRLLHPLPCAGTEPVIGMSRRRWLQSFGMGLGGLALVDLMSRSLAAETTSGQKTHFPARAKRIIYLFQSGAPSQMDLFDYKPLLNEKHGTELPQSVRMMQRLTSMSANQASLPLVGSPFEFRRHGETGAWLSELLPHTAEIADDLCFVKSMHTPAINHGPGVTFMQSGSQFPGRPSMGAWLNYGLGSENENLPAFVVMVTKDKGGQPLFSRLWGSGFLPSKFDGVRLLPGKDPVLYLNNPQGVTSGMRRDMLDTLRELHQMELEQTADPEIENRIAQYELAFRMQSSIPEVFDFSNEPAYVLDDYGPDVHQPGSFAAHCLLARRLAERDVRFIQLYHPDWDHHADLVRGITRLCRETDQPSAALIRDLKRHGLLDDTLVVWGGEFGRTNYCQGKLTKDSFGRDHHPRCFTLWLAGAGIRPGTYGQTDEYGYNVVEDAVEVHDLHATILHLMGIDHERLTYKYQGRRFRLTDIHGKLVNGIIS
jgi:hypothetical protein